MCSSTLSAVRGICTVNAGDLAPHDSDLGATDLLRGAVDEGDLLSEVEAAGLGVVDTLNLDQTGVGVGVALASLVAEVTSPVRKEVNIRSMRHASFVVPWMESVESAVF
jgi:hypothetical protein